MSRNWIVTVNVFTNGDESYEDIRELVQGLVSHNKNITVCSVQRKRKHLKTRKIGELAKTTTKVEF